MKVVIVNEDGLTEVRTIEDTGLSDLPGLFRVVRRGPEGEDGEATPWMSSRSAEARLHFEASLRGLYVRGLEALDDKDEVVFGIECDKASVDIPWKSV